jgi:hypothetical protein
VKLLIVAGIIVALTAVLPFFGGAFREEVKDLRDQLAGKLLKKLLTITIGLIIIGGLTYFLGTKIIQSSEDSEYVSNMQSACNEESNYTWDPGRQMCVPNEYLDAPYDESESKMEPKPVLRADSYIEEQANARLSKEEYEKKLAEQEAEDAAKRAEIEANKRPDIWRECLGPGYNYDGFSNTCSKEDEDGNWHGVEFEPDGYGGYKEIE